MNDVTVEKAIKKAWRLRWVSALLSVIPPLVIMVYVAVNDYNPLYVPLVFVLFIIIGWVFINIAIQKWRLWAFSNVKRVQLLKKIASEDGFISKKLFSKLEYSSQRYKTEWRNLQYRLENKDEIQEDVSTPESIVIKKRIFNILTFTYLIVVPVMLLMGVSLLPYTFDLLLVIPYVIVVLLYDIKRVKKVFDRNVSLKVDDEHIIVDNDRIYKWNTIENENVIPIYIRTHKRGGNENIVGALEKVPGSGRQRIFAITFKYDGEEIYIPLYMYKTKRIEMIRILETFRIRHNRSKG